VGSSPHVPALPGMSEVELATADVWATVEAEKVNIVLIVGDAFGRPLLDELARSTYDLSSLILLVSGGAALSVLHSGEGVLTPLHQSGTTCVIQAGTLVHERELPALIDSLKRRGFMS
jgi:hypothetical protein